MGSRGSSARDVGWLAGFALLIQACSSAPPQSAPVVAQPSALHPTSRSTTVADPSSGLTLTVPWPITARVDSFGVHLRHEIPYRHVDFCDQSDRPHAWFDTVVDLGATLQLQPLAPVACMAAMSPELASRVQGDSVRTTPGYVDAVVFGGRRGYRMRVGIEGCGAESYWLELGNGTLLVRRGTVPLVTPIYRYWRDVLAVPGVLTPAAADSLLEVVVGSAEEDRP